MRKGASKDELAAVESRIAELGYKPHVIHGDTRNVVGAVGDERGKAVLQSIESMSGVENVVPILKPYKLASKEVKLERTAVEIAPGVTVGGDQLVVMAGPCSVESEEQILEGLKLLAMAREETGLPVVTEVVNPRDVDLVAKYADVMQVGARNVQNFALLKMLGTLDKPILLKRGMSTTIQEFLMSAEYILSEGNQKVILCERGIRTFETATRNTLDISAVPVLQEQTHLPIIIDPSHATGHASLVPSMCYAAVAAGADGLIVEVHPHPEVAASDGPQSLRPADFQLMMTKLAEFAKVVGKTL
jgi:3-deoxy-7-phosphoheptulonate synthase